MLAVRLKGDVLQQHDLVVAADLLEGAAEMHRRILGITAGIFAPSARDAARRVEQTFAVGIVASPPDESADRLPNVLWNLAGRRGFYEIAVFRLAVIQWRIHLSISRAISSATAAAC